MLKEKIREVEEMEGSLRATENSTMKREKEERLAISERVFDPEVSEKATRRKYTVRYKLRILKEADGCTQMGSLGGLLRREGLYHSYLNTWRRQREEGTLSALVPKKRGRKRAVCNPFQSEMDRLEKENEGLRNRLHKAEIIIDVQKKSLTDLGDSSGGRGREKKALMEAAAHLAGEIGVKPACESLNLSRAGFYRNRARSGLKGTQVKKRLSPPRALTSKEQKGVLEILHSERFVDKAPQEVYATLLDERQYHCSISTMYRLLRGSGEIKERRNQLRHPNYSKPELLAEAPNQVWSWDITKLLGPVKWCYYYLYVIMDIFSRYVVGWMVAHRESAVLAGRLIRETCEKQGIEKGALTIHADRGSSMKSKAVALLLSDLGVTKTHSRPYTSNDNPYSESQFKTLKYRPDFPERFGSIEDSRHFCRNFFEWYNKGHRHSGIALLTPEVVHYGRAKEVLSVRQEVLDAAYHLHPERFVKKVPVPPELPLAAWINKPTLVQTSDGALH